MLVRNPTLLLKNINTPLPISQGISLTDSLVNTIGKRALPQAMAATQSLQSKAVIVAALSIPLTAKIVALASIAILFGIAYIKFFKSASKSEPAKSPEEILQDLFTAKKFAIRVLTFKINDDAYRMRVVFNPQGKQVKILDGRITSTDKLIIAPENNFPDDLRKHVDSLIPAGISKSYLIGEVNGGRFYTHLEDAEV